MYTVISNEKLNSSNMRMKVQAPAVAAKALPGQFVIIRTDKYGERIPLTIADHSTANGSVTVIYQPVGLTTMKLAALKAGDEICDFVGPLGHPTEFGDIKSAVIIGGGVGCAIACPSAKYLHEKGVKTTMIAGFRNRDMLMLEDEMRAGCDKLIITTDDGSYIRRGFVTDVLKEQIDAGEKYDLCVAIGPVPMMRAVAKLAGEYSLRTLVSLNPIMIDGTGMCGGCRVRVGGETKFACVDGPDFDASEVDFDDLMRRNSAYKQQETAAREHACKLFGGNE